MSDPDEELRKAVALFRFGLIADVLRLPPGSREIRRTLGSVPVGGEILRQARGDTLSATGLDRKQEVSPSAGSDVPRTSRRQATRLTFVPVEQKSVLDTSRMRMIGRLAAAEPRGFN